MLKRLSGHAPPKSNKPEPATASVLHCSLPSFSSLNTGNKKTHFTFADNGTSEKLTIVETGLIPIALLRIAGVKGD